MDDALEDRLGVVEELISDFLEDNWNQEDVWYSAANDANANSVVYVYEFERIEVSNNNYAIWNSMWRTMTTTMNTTNTFVWVST